MIVDLQAADAYIENHYKDGVCTVFGNVDKASGLSQLTMCVESHGFEPKNFWNGRWRSQWTTQLTDREAELKGLIKVQVHYFEDGNVQLVSSKDVARKINVSVSGPSGRSHSLQNDADATAKEIIRVIEEEETQYQTAVHENYQTMSDTTFKALRRQLPVTRTKFDWSKVQAYRVGQEINKVD